MRLILGVMVPIVQELGAKKGPKISIIKIKHFCSFKQQVVFKCMNPNSELYQAWMLCPYFPQLFRIQPLRSYKAAPCRAPVFFLDWATAIYKNICVVPVSLLMQSTLHLRILEFFFHFWKTDFDQSHFVNLNHLR